MSDREPFWMAPRRLCLLLEDGDLTPTAYAILMYVAPAGADRDGFLTTYQSLAALFDVSTKTIARSLAQLRAAGAVVYDLQAGQRTPFRIHLGETALAAVTSGTTSDTPRTRGGGSVSEVTSDTTSPSTERNPASDLGKTSDTTSDSYAGAETETEKEKEHAAAVGLPQDGGGGEALEPDSFIRTIAGLGPTPAQQSRWRAAFDEDPVGFARVVEESRRDGRAPAGLLTSKLKRKEHRGRAGRRNVTASEIRELARELDEAEVPKLAPPARAPTRIIDDCWKCGARGPMFGNWLCETCHNEEQAAEQTILVEAMELVHEGVWERRS